MTNNSLSRWSRLGLGTGTLASLGRSASLTEVSLLLDAMIATGATVIDTADSYASGGCERLLGKALLGRRNKFVIATKAGYLHADFPRPFKALNQWAKKGMHLAGLRQCFSPSYLTKSLERSLSRLGCDAIDAFLLHSPSPEVIKDQAVHAMCGRLISAGKTLHVGLSSESPDVIRAAIDSGIFKVIQTPANLMVSEALMPLWNDCAAAGIHLMGNHVFSPACIASPGMTHETLMRAASALLPQHATLLCGTRKPAHFKQTHEWVHNPMPDNEAALLLSRCHS
jgi:aryl-alcohol dehydrogenase-like predicted oxidoreductase